MKKSKIQIKDLTWLASRICDDEVDPSVPDWRAMNEAMSIVDPPVTTMVMLPILQAPAGDNDTIITVTNCFIAISKHMRQKYTIIMANQLLYSRSKEICWSNSKFDNVIFVMGGLHICFNFLKPISQHISNAGLDDLWTESGAYATKTTETMLDGKAYYQAVRAHMLTCEALQHIKWSMFKTIAHQKGTAHFADFKIFQKYG